MCARSVDLVSVLPPAQINPATAADGFVAATTEPLLPPRALCMAGPHVTALLCMVPPPVNSDCLSLTSAASVPPLLSGSDKSSMREMGGQLVTSSAPDLTSEEDNNLGWPHHGSWDEMLGSERRGGREKVPDGAPAGGEIMRRRTHGCRACRHLIPLRSTRPSPNQLIGRQACGVSWLVCC